MDREVMGDQGAVGEEVMLLVGERTKVMVDDAQDELQPFPSLWACGVLIMSVATRSSMSASPPCC